MNLSTGAINICRSQPRRSYDSSRSASTWDSSETNLQIRDVQQVMSRQLGASLRSRRAQGLQEANQCLDQLERFIEHTRADLTHLGCESVPQEPSTSAQPPPELGASVQKCSKTLYAHVPLQLRTQIQHHVFVDYHKLLADPMLPFKSTAFVLQKNSETGIPEWQETTTTKEIPSYEVWARAFRTYAAIYLMAHPQRSVELLKYQALIHTASLRYEWNSVLAYDFYFRQSMAKDPSKSWGMTDTQLYTDCFTKKGLPKVDKVSHSHTPQKFQQPCYDFNKGSCKWKKCRYQHKCSVCGKPTHPAMKCCQGQTPKNPQGAQNTV